jgi:demethylmenaquinone methyltransferase/2-methoxy-6-polyprenyl-1,4-benzoquinol methylase
MTPPPLDTREAVREEQFSTVWTEELNHVFADVARYYDRANHVASLGLWGWFLRSFMATVDVRPGERVLDVCAGTNAVGIALLKREPTLEVHAMDRSAEMQEIGRQRAEAHGFRIRSVIGDVHVLPYPDDHFDVVTLQYASRHLRLRHMFGEVRRVLKPGGRFYHCDMLRPESELVAAFHYAYLRFCLAFTALVFRSGKAALNCRNYFIHALQMFYSPREVSLILADSGFQDVTVKSIFTGIVGYHRAVKPPAS